MENLLDSNLGKEDAQNPWAMQDASVSDSDTSGGFETWQGVDSAKQEAQRCVLMQGPQTKWSLQQTSDACCLWSGF